MIKKKILITLFLLLILVANLSFASYSTVTMSIVEEPICTIPIGENSKFEKKLIAKDLNHKEVTLQLQVTNEETTLKPTGEMILLLDNSNSMELETAEGKIRKDLVFNSAKKLLSNLLENNAELKIGVVSFSTNTDISKEGTIEDASVISGLSNDITTLTNAISNIEANGPRTNLEAGLSLASQQFSTTDNNKYMIILTDGVPNVALNYDNIYYSDDVINKTKTQLQKLGTNKIDITTMLTGIDNADELATGSTKTYGEIITEIFGTTENPTIGKFYYVTDSQVENTITKDIYNSLLPTKKTLKDIKIVDYFPKEIIDNFDFAYVTEANIGKISSEVNATNHSITWIIPELSSGQTATVQYKLKLKENFDRNIIDKILNTNEKVDITYTDFENKEQNKTSDVSPKLKLIEPPAILPKAGFTPLLITFGMVAVGFFLFSLTKLVIIHHKIK